MTRRSAFAFAFAFVLCAPSARGDTARDGLDFLRMVTVTGYLQPQLVVQLHDGDKVVAQPGSITSNEDFFRLRRARLKLEVSPDDWARATFEVEPFTKGGTFAKGTHLRNVEAGGIARFSRDVSLEFAAGQFNVPFGGEVLESNALRPFIDASFAAGALFPGDFDIGVRATFTAHRFTFVSSVINGVMLGEPTQAALPDLNRGKDVTARAVYDFGGLSVAANGYIGSGQIVDSDALRFKSFRRWAANVEATLDRTFVPSLGRTKVVSAFTYATNMDRGVGYAFALPDFPSDLSRTVVDKHEVGFMARAEQDVSPRFTFGARYDYYTPDTSVAQNGRHAITGVAVVHFTQELQLMLEYADAFDRVHAPATTSISKQIQTVSTVFQVRF